MSDKKRRKRVVFTLTYQQRKQLEPLIQVTNTVVSHWDGIIRWFKYNINNGVLEGINNSIKAAKRKVRGYCSSKNLITMIYLIVGKINLDSILHLLPT